MPYEAGHHGKRVYISQDGVLVVPSSAAGIAYENVSLTTSRTTEVAAGNLKNYGHTIITTTGVGTLKLARPFAGAEKIITWGSTAAKLVKVRVVQTVDEAAPLVKIGPKIAGAGATVVYASTDSFKNQFKATKYGLGPTITLVGYSTARWIVKSLAPSNTTGAGVPWIFATST
jgi:hypothetical protein